MERKHRIIPVVVLHDEQETHEKLSALLEGGIKVAEITFRTPFAEQAIKIALKEFPEMDIGAGTVINIDQACKAINAGVKFIVSPGFSAKIAEICQKNDIEYFPGCVTPTEIMEALEYNIKVIKFFPGNVYGGLKAIEALSGPFPQVTFLPTGGVNENNIDEYLSSDKIYAVGGSFMMKGDIVKNCQNLKKWLI